MLFNKINVIVLFSVVSWVNCDGPVQHNFKYKDEVKLNATFGITFNWNTKIENCGPNCYKYPNATLTIQNHANDSDRYVIKWTATDASLTLEDCFDFGDMQWFGGPEQKEQYWPIQKLRLHDFAYVTKEAGNCAVAEPYWLASNGAYIYIDKRVPLFVDQDNHRQNKVCFYARNAAPYRTRQQLIFEYEIVLRKDVKEAHQHAVKNFLGKPTGIPNKEMITYPVWSTWARYKRDIDEKVVEEFGNEILSYNFTNGQLEIDDDWEICYGALEFRSSKFPNAPALIKRLKQKFRVTLWVHPFININCKATFDEAVKNNYLVKNLNGDVKTQWWNSKSQEASMVDFTNPKAAEWWSQRLRSLQNITGLDGYKFDAGETSWAPQVPVFEGDQYEQPSIFTKEYVETCAKFGDLSEVRSAQRSQSLPIFVRIVDKDSRWGFDNGLRTLITTMLQMNLNGYPLVLPDMVGGNVYEGDTVDKDLFLRWLQANVFMPSIQFSVVPWDFDNETVTISHKMLSLHEKYADKIIYWAKKSVSDGSPLNPPIWWIDPTNPEALKIDDEFLLGEEILAAPVVEENQRSRDIYLPAGNWIDGNTGANYTGRRWIRNYPAPLDTLPYFIKIGS